MIRLPLAARELSRVSRSSRMFWLRTIVVLSAALLLLILTEISTRRPLDNPEVLGLMMHAIGTLFQFGIAFLVIPGITGSLIADERRNGSLGLLLIADFGGLDIFLAKFISAFFEAELLLLGTMPIMAFATILGGVSLPLVINQFILLSLFGFAACCLGLLTSSFVRHAVSAILLNAMVIAGLFGLNLLVREFVFWNFRTTLPFFDAIRGFDHVLRGGAVTQAWPDLAAIPLAGLIAAALTLWWLPRAAVTGPRRRWFGPSTPYGATHRRLLRQSPAAPFFACHSAGFLSTLQASSSRRTLAVGMAAIAFAPALGGLAVLCLLCYDVTLSITSMRREGALDDLLLTRLGERRLARDLYRYHLRRAAVYFPAFLVVGIQLGVLLFVLMDQAIPTESGYVRVYALIADMPAVGLLMFDLVMGLLLVAFMVMQGPASVAVACASGAAPPGKFPAWVRAVVVMIVLYAVLIAVGASLHYWMFEFGSFRNVPWLPSLTCTVIAVGLFGGMWWLSYRILLRRIGVNVDVRLQRRLTRGFHHSDTEYEATS